MQIAKDTIQVIGLCKDGNVEARLTTYNTENGIQRFDLVVMSKKAKSGAYLSTASLAAIERACVRTLGIQPEKLSQFLNAA
ncbi:hypothetical protein C9I92_10455 [Photobacterium ganghwense]|uniref:Uncharacterized protein n=1 Tax=Photobacterium ganghwense TaxID=320778 RepID=A0A0J1HF21_9GAMM|nr:hypothetical protein [Photobacterium ganghwense]KLV10211.1 hypothetical protein ABT57_06450 [Photobacterium ganghwense]PSU09913.1 hypothetical protein C9I92_10455 [Photobacterium ganghwense]